MHNVIENAMRAGPEFISANATIQTWDGTVVREGSNDWICLPDRPDTPGDGPWCVTGAWMIRSQETGTETKRQNGCVRIAKR